LELTLKFRVSIIIFVRHVLYMSDMSTLGENLKKELEELIARLLMLTIDTYENFINIITEFLRKVSPIPIVIPQIILPEHLKKKSTEELAKLLANLIVTPLNPQQALKIIEDIIKRVDELKSRYFTKTR